MKFKIAVATFVSWLVVLLGVVAWVLSRDVTFVNFTLVPASFNATYDDFSLAPPGRPLVLHFVDETCQCNRFSSPHIRRLETHLAADVLHVSYRKSRDETFETGIAKLAAIVPASPAVAIWDAEGKLRYYGPYSNGAVCGEGNDMVLYALREINASNEIRWLAQEYVGCVCPWKS